MVRVTALTSPLLLGFDDLERALDKVSKAGTDGYPPYNIERIAANVLKAGSSALYPPGPELCRVRMVNGKNRTGRL